MDIASIIILGKAVLGLGKEPSDDSGIPARPNCGPGKTARWNQQLKRWDCILGID